jgi:hypothetical protein
MNFKLGLMHAPKPVNRFPSAPTDGYSPRRVAAANARPVEFLVRVRELRRGALRSWKGN